MGLQEHDSYQSVNGSDSRALPSMRRSVRSWADSIRLRMNDVFGGWDEAQWKKVGGGGGKNFLVRIAEGCYEETPAFTRALTAGGIKQAIIMMLCLLCAFTVVHWMLLPATSSSLVPAPSLCASQDDMYDTASRLCQVGNKYAFWFMKHKSWVQCAPNIPGYRMLVSTGADFNGNYWYTVKQAKEVRIFYDTCIPECATDEDTYHSDRDMCVVTDGVLVTFLNGDGQQCARRSAGEKAIRVATSSMSSGSRGGRYWYKPDAVAKVRSLLESCHATCAKGDPLLHDKEHCQVMNNLAVQFLSKAGGTCDKKLPGYSMFGSLGHTKDVQGAFMYPRSVGDQIEQFYLSCMRGWKPSRHAFGTVSHNSETVRGKTLRQAQEASQNRRDEKKWDEAIMMSDNGY